MVQDPSNYLLDAERLKTLEDSDLVAQKLAEGQCYQDILGYSNETMLEFYQAALRMYDDSRYEDAVNALYFISFLNPYNAGLWMTMGACFELMDQKEAATRAYVSGAMMEPKNLSCVGRAIVMCTEIHQPAMAEFLLKYVEQLAESDDPALKELKEEAKEVLGALEG